MGGLCGGTEMELKMVTETMGDGGGNKHSRQHEIPMSNLRWVLARKRVN